MGIFTDEMTVNAYKMAYAQGYDHKYPNENVVRIESSFLAPCKGRCLDYGFGFGENLIHFACKEYEMYGVDVDDSLITRLRKKIAMRKISLKHKPQLFTLEHDTERLPYEDNFFDCILSNQVIYLLADERKILHLLKEFHRITRPGGRLLITLMGEKNCCCVQGRYLGNNVYEYDDSSKMNKIKGNFIHRYYIVHSRSHIQYLFKDFVIDEIGSFDNDYCGIGGHHYVVMCHIPQS